MASSYSDSMDDALSDYTHPRTLSARLNVVFVLTKRSQFGGIFEEVIHNRLCAQRIPPCSPYPKITTQTAINVFISQSRIRPV